MHDPIRPMAFAVAPDLSVDAFITELRQGSTDRPPFAKGETVRHDSEGRGVIVSVTDHTRHHAPLGLTSPVFDTVELLTDRGGMFLTSANRLHHGHYVWVDDD